MVFCMFLFCHTPRPASCAFKGIYFEKVSCHSLLVDFDFVFTVFFRGIVLSAALESFPFPSPSGATIFANLRPKFAKTPAIGGKVCMQHKY